jgi:predicted 3-demethylubiquinone-9 3-methyltransferase (glyoxalase superfamily)
MQKVSTCLWFDTQAFEAASFYVGLFKNSAIVTTTYYGDGAHKPKGTVLVVYFQLDGRDFVALNGGPHFKLTPAVSLSINCETQTEIDTLHSQLSVVPEAEQCGWVQDKYGLSWQLVPSILPPLLRDADAAKAQRVMQAMMGMKKLDIAALQAAAA